MPKELQARLFYDSPPVQRDSTGKVNTRNRGIFCRSSQIFPMSSVQHAVFGGFSFSERGCALFLWRRPALEACARSVSPLQAVSLTSTDGLHLRVLGKDDQRFQNVAPAHRLFSKTTRE